MKKGKAHERSQSLSKEGQEYGHKHRKRYKMRKKKHHTIIIRTYFLLENLFGRMWVFFLGVRLV